MSKKREIGHVQKIKELVKANSYSRASWEVFQDFVEVAAISIRTAAVWKSEPFETRFEEIRRKYSDEEFGRFSEMLAETVLELENWMSDVLGEVYMELELGNKWKGQFFTPYHVSQAMASVTLSWDVAGEVERKGFVTVAEPSCGSGGMVIAFAEAMKKEGVNFQGAMHATCTDIDLKCAHMAYVQLSLLWIPAVVVHGNTLTMEEWSHWPTPFHTLFGWDWILARRHENRIIPVS